MTLAVDSGALLARWPGVAELFIHPESLDEHRWQIWRDTWPMIRDHLWLGSGLETYGVLSDSYRSFYSNLRWLQAHNDYLQWLAETGLVAPGWRCGSWWRWRAAAPNGCARRPRGRSDAWWPRR